MPQALVKLPIPLQVYPEIEHWRMMTMTGMLVGYSQTRNHGLTEVAQSALILMIPTTGWAIS